MRYIKLSAITYGKCLVKVYKKQLFYHNKHNLEAVWDLQLHS